MWRNLFILYFVFVKKQRAIERKKKRSKISALESCYANRIYGTFGVEMRAYGQKLVKFCTQTHRRVNLSIVLAEQQPVSLIVRTLSVVFPFHLLLHNYFKKPHRYTLYQWTTRVSGRRCLRFSGLSWVVTVTFQNIAACKLLFFVKNIAM